jgi:hypothetical protein
MFLYPRTYIVFNRGVTGREIIFSFVGEGEINNSWEDRTDTAKMTIPKKIGFKDENGNRLKKDIAGGTDPAFKRGDSVEIYLGYSLNMDLRFSGFISKITPKLPIEIECEDIMWKLKQVTVTKSYTSVTLKQLLTDILPAGIPFQAVDVGLGKFRITRATVVQVFEELQKTYGLEVWARDGKIYAGLAYVPELRIDHKFRFQRNIIEDSLAYQNGDDVKIKVKAISIAPDNKKTEYETGDPDGETRTLHFYNVSQADLKKLAEEELPKLKYTGFAGGFTTFGEPFVRHGDGATLQDPKLPERDGTYLVKNVKTSFGTGGIRQEIDIDRKIA